MALLKCPECNKEFSEYAAACPNCGCPIDIVKQHLHSSNNAQDNMNEPVKLSSGHSSNTSDRGGSFNYIPPKNTVESEDDEIPLVNMARIERILCYIFAVFVFWHFLLHSLVCELFQRFCYFCLAWQYCQEKESLNFGITGIFPIPK